MPGTGRVSISDLLRLWEILEFRYNGVYGQERGLKYDSNRGKNKLFGLSARWIAKSNG